MYWYNHLPLYISSLFFQTMVFEWKMNTEKSYHRCFKCIFNFSCFFRADFWVYGSIYAIEKTVELANENCFTNDCHVPKPSKFIYLYFNMYAFINTLTIFCLSFFWLSICPWLNRPVKNLSQKQIQYIFCCKFTYENRRICEFWHVL